MISIAACFRHIQSKYEAAHPGIILGLFALGFIALMMVQNLGAYATTMWDEWEYDRYARLRPIAAADVPYYLYYLVYRSTLVCGDGFMGCAQFLNAIFFAASAPFIYLVTRRTVSKNVSLLIAMASVVGGISAYATHFVIEPMYFFGFWLMVWGLLKVLDAKVDALALGVGAGAALALLMLIKLHAIFLLPGLVLFIFVCAVAGFLDGGISTGLLAAFCAVVSFFAVRLSAGYLFAGEAGWNLFGAAYEDHASSAVSSRDALLNIVRPALPIFAAHTAAVCMFYAVPVTLMLTPKSNRKILPLQILTVCFLVPLLLVVSMYSAHVRMTNPTIEGDEFVRLHMRYYNFIFPAFVIMAASAVEYLEADRFNIWRLVAAAILCASIAAFVLNIGHYQLSIFDGPELRGIATLHGVLYAFVFLSGGSLCVWVWQPRRAALGFMVVLFPVLTIMGAVAVAYSAHKEHVPTVFHRAGLFAHRQLGANVDDLTVIAPDYAGVFQALFYADNAGIAYRYDIENHACLNFVPNVDGKDWVLLIGDFALPPETEIKTREDGFMLIHLPQKSVVQTMACAG